MSSSHPLSRWHGFRRHRGFGDAAPRRSWDNGTDDETSSLHPLSHGKDTGELARFPTTQGIRGTQPPVVHAWDHETDGEMLILLN
ncbi:MAG: hypothetical protein IKP00_15805 [Victivallales bacterium]|nr:hypothetical protein [Victivallales bacterium]